MNKVDHTSSSSLPPSRILSYSNHQKITSLSTIQNSQHEQQQYEQQNHDNS